MPNPNFVPVATLTDDADGPRVATDWRVDGVLISGRHSYLLGSRKLAERLQAAINAGAVYPEPRMATDVYGDRYVQASALVMGKYANADLKRLGY